MLCTARLFIRSKERASPARRHTTASLISGGLHPHTSTDLTNCRLLRWRNRWVELTLPIFAPGHSRRFSRVSVTSGLPLTTDVQTTGWGSSLHSFVVRHPGFFEE